MKWIKDLLYSRGNKYAEISRVSAMLLILTYIGLSIADFSISLEFDHVLFASGATVLVGGLGTWVHFRKKTETVPELMEKELA